MSPLKVYKKAEHPCPDCKVEMFVAVAGKGAGHNIVTWRCPQCGREVKTEVWNNPTRPRTK